MIKLQPKEIELLKLQKFEDEDVFQAKSKDLIDKVAPELQGLYFHPQNETGGYGIVVDEKLLKAFPREKSKIHVGYETDAELAKRVALIRGSKEKHKGKVSGIPDWIIKWKGILFSIELKLEKKSSKLGESQEIIHQKWNMDFPEIPVFVCRNLYEVYCVIEWILTKQQFFISKN